MTKLSITLFDENGDKVSYEQDKVPGKRVLDFWDLQEKCASPDYTPKQNLLDRVDFVASLFDQKAVTADAILNGLNSWELEGTVDNLILTAVGVRHEDDPKELASPLEKEKSDS
uniref:Phage protein n=1 Tax=Siphoviridae sp. ctHjK2 TaxID=2827831 RepID=A0A8S5SQN6_9CAUD|nr:MAG TPA: hypothetical protein [Siphoviridae sp. ctHjK2]